MVTYSNGNIPASLLITFNVGYTSGEGDWKHQLSPGTYAKHLALVTLARKNTGRTLALSAGWSGYRPYAAQVYARQRYGNGAATPGTSSHGGFWEGQQTLAIDYGNWSYVYGGSRDAFYRDARVVGFEPGLISPQRGYPDEPWHVVDKQPWASGSGAGNDSTSWEDIMAKLDDDDRAWLDRQFELVRALLQVPGQPYGWPQANSNAIAAITPLIGDVQNRVRGSDPRGDMLQLIREDLGKPIKADVDEAALAREIAPLLPGQMGALSDADVARIAKAAADEQARRLAT